MKIAAPAGRNNLAIVSPLFRRSAAEDQRQSHLKMEETQPGHAKFFAQTLEEEIVEGALVHFLLHVASIQV